ncbi:MULTISPECIES: isoaspartyl peptidase/L-asparaginase family protein [unclassified Lentimicrobium]|uniref:isoaspartyl peptidase/L-asparaginase family protein n=1 Tax=unclassified Lentimicrobium TaxID=2677434 RepID=UPI0015550EC3|nr:MULTISPECIES: isoaspartyl peptidase/L-asparaginase [unclassified Lentimicrobium]NPD44224.1 isoaspartyl peptidase/L-asparaginase [Lentimicrobium sp. S6]NPD85762.1 isoaspartyl peptidase/L-asparaginase [Lentimicrobium sp. L6]
MKKYLPIILILLWSCQMEVKNEKEQKIQTNPDWTIVIHGGAGDIEKEGFSEERQSEYKQKLEEAIQAGSVILENGGTSLEAVEASIHIMEDSPLFNAGKGAVFNALGQNEMDASIMDGKSGKAGAVAGVRHIKNPISAAIAVMEKSPHVLLIGDGAEKFASEHGVEITDTSWFYTEKRWKSYEKMKQDKHGTVGCVALDKHGNITAGTSTGGMTMKMPGRVGDSPIIGAGTYADNHTCGISATGHGEFFIRNVVAYDVAAIMKYQGKSIEEAANYVIQDKLKSQNASGGIIGLDAQGNIIMEFNTTAMFRASNRSDDDLRVAIFK